MRGTRDWARSVVVPFVAALAGCSVVADPGEFEADACPASGERLVDLSLRIRPGTDLAPSVDAIDKDGERWTSPRHRWRFVVVQPVAQDDGVIVQRRLLEGSSAGLLRRDGDEHRLFVREAVPAGALWLYVWLDEDGDGAHTIDADVPEPAWQVPLCDGRAAVALETTRRFPGEVFEGIERSTGDFELDMADMRPHVPGVQHVRGVVVDVERDRVVGWFEDPDLEQAEPPSFRLSGVLAPGRDYLVEFYADITENGTFEQPGAAGDHAWILSGRSDDDGDLRLEFSHHGRFDRLTRF